MLLDTKYNYVIFGSDGYYDVGYADLKTCPNVLYLSHYMQTVRNPLVRLVTRLTFSQKVNRIVHYPFSRFTFKRLLSLPFKDNKPLCFLYFGNVYWCTAFLVKPPYFDYLKQRYPNAKFGMYLQDIVARNPHLDMPSIKQQFDFVLSYDKGDCEKYGLTYYPTPYSAYPIPTNNDIAKSDLYFCGNGKNRYPLIHDIYQQCTQKGLKCDFYISGMPSSAEKIEGIHYTSLTYLENLQHMIQSKCILEIMQDGADGYTPRLWESLLYNKHLLTNNKSILSSPFYRQAFIHQVDKELNTITEWIHQPVESITEQQREDLSPKALIRFIDNIITTH